MIYLLNKKNKLNNEHIIFILIIKFLSKFEKKTYFSKQLRLVLVTIIKFLLCFSHFF